MVGGNPVETEPPDKRGRVRFGRGIDTLSFQPFQDEGVDRILYPASVLDAGNRGLRRWPEGPTGMGCTGRHRQDLFRRGSFWLSPEGALIDPSPEQSYLLGRQLISPHRHDRVLSAFLQAGYQMDQPTLLTLSRNNDCTGVAARQGYLPAVQPQASELLLYSVAGVAPGLENGLDVSLEIHLDIGRRRQPDLGLLRGEQAHPAEETHPGHRGFLTVETHEPFSRGDTQSNWPKQRLGPDQSEHRS